MPYEALLHVARFRSKVRFKHNVGSISLIQRQKMTGTKGELGYTE